MPLAFVANNRLEIAAYSQVESAVWIGSPFGLSAMKYGGAAAVPA
jgi:hypothetical protein